MYTKITIRMQCTIICVMHMSLTPQGDKSYPFDRVLFCNIGDCHAMGQRPITFIRQLLAACTNPTDLLESGIYPCDVVERAKDILSHCKGYSIGKNCVCMRGGIL